MKALSKASIFIVAFVATMVLGNQNTDRGGFILLGGAETPQEIKKADLKEVTPIKRVAQKNAVKTPEIKKKSLNLDGLLGGLQDKVAFKKAAPSQDSEVSPKAHSSNRAVRGLKAVATPTLDSVDSDYYTVPGGEVFLDDSSVGDDAPSDNVVD